MQIYWGAIPFVIIQIIMVGLIIAFPGIVSSGLDKTAAVDLDKVGAEMMATMPSNDPQAPAPAIDSSAPEGSTATPVSEPASGTDANTDPMKALEESMKANK
jgi:GntP family gluconate:H+ symporter